MAGSTVTSGTAQSSGGMPGTYRVRLDIRRIQANVYAAEGARLSERTVRDWLCAAGFTPTPDGVAWLADADSLRRLERSEIVRAERVRDDAPATALVG